MGGRSSQNSNWLQSFFLYGKIDLLAPAADKWYLGFMYTLGRGVLKDSVLAHMWFNIAGTNGSETARES